MAKKIYEKVMFVGRAKTFVVGVAAIVAVLVAASCSMAARPAHAANFTVGSTADAGDVSSQDFLCDADPAPSGFQCTLRAAIEQANALDGQHTINFNIPGGGVKTIKPSSELPIIARQVTIDGYSQPGASQNTLLKGTNANILIELNGENLSGFASGLRVEASNTVVKGLTINRFGGNGIVIGSGVGSKIEGNFIGTDPLGTSPLGNDNNGVLIINSGALGNTVGGTSPEARNLISANHVNGVFTMGSSENQVYGNLIGTKKDGTSPLGNSDDGVDFFGATNNFVGDLSSGGANTIAFNGAAGVLVRDDSTVPNDESFQNRVIRNSIFSNGSLGIDLGSDGPTANDAGDADTGPNELQNKPAIGSAKSSATATTVKGSLSSEPGQTYTVSFFKNPSGNEGKTFVGQKQVTTGSDGKATFTFEPAKRVGLGQTVTATATDSVGNTSEFSAPRTVVAQ